MINPRAGRSRDQPICRPPLNKIKTRATETTCCTVSSRGDGTSGTRNTPIAAAASIQTGAGSLSRADNLLTNTAARAMALVSVMIRANRAVSDMCCSSAESFDAWTDCRPAFPAHRVTHYKSVPGDPLRGGQGLTSTRTSKGLSGSRIEYS